VRAIQDVAEAFSTTHRHQFPEGPEAGKAFDVVGDEVAHIKAHAKAILLTKGEGRQARVARISAYALRAVTVTSDLRRFGCGRA
jgi:hypothetical protein